MTIKKVLSELILFAKNPQTNLTDSQLSVKPVKLFFILFGINFLLGFFLSAIGSIIRAIFHINFSAIDISMLHLVIINIFLIPVIEEVAFRLPLKVGKWNTSLSLFVISFIISSYLLKTAPINFHEFMIVRVIISTFAFLIVFILLSRRIIFERVKNSIKNNYKSYFYILLILFTLRHVDNYQFNVITILFLPIFLLPQLVGGFFMAYTRLKINFIASIFFHFLINVIAFAPLTIALLLNN